MPQGNERTIVMEESNCIQAVACEASPSSNYYWTSSPVIDFKTKQNLLPHIFPPCSCCCWRSGGGGGGSCMATMMFSSSNCCPSPHLLCHCTFCPPAGGWRGWAVAGGSPATPGPVLRPHTGPTLMRCSCFQIQPLILILFLIYSPLLAPLLNPRSPPRTPRTWRWSLFKALI